MSTDAKLSAACLGAAIASVGLAVCIWQGFPLDAPGLTVIAAVFWLASRVFSPDGDL